MRKLPQNITKQLLFDLYITQKKSVKEVGEILSKSLAQVSRYLKRFSISTRPFSTTGLKTRLGAKLSEETKAKIRAKAIGRKIPPEVRRRMGSKGYKNPGWIDGRTPTNKLIRNSVEYRLWREAVFKRDNFTCQMCWKRGGYLHADHIKPFAYYPELRFAIDNGRTLCLCCHRKTDTYGFRGKRVN